MTATPAARPRAARAALVASAALGGLVLLVPACGDGEDPVEERTVTLSGTTYTFNTPNPVEGAVVRIAEQPGIEAVSDEDGAWSLEVRAGGAVTPWVSHPNHVDMFVQTFTADDDIPDIYFQMVMPGIFAAMEAILEIEADPELCQIVTTVSERAIQGMTFPEFAAHRAHGVADAIAAMDPPAVEPVYFNAQVLPDRTHTETSRDGGVVWTNVPPGVYTLYAQHDELSFAEAVVTCEPGRFINANPPQGLRELVD